MKKILLGILLITSINTFSQTINFVDPNFKQALLNHRRPVIDTNGNNEIEESEAQVIKALYLYEGNFGVPPITNISGIEKFTDVENIVLNGNSLTTADFSNNSKLKFLNLNNNNLTSVNLSQNYLLEELKLSNNNLTNVYLNNNTKLTYLEIISNNLSGINVSTLNNLTSLYLSDNKITSVDFSQNNKLEVLNISINRLRSLDVRNCSLFSLFFVNNPDIKTAFLKNQPFQTRHEWGATDQLSINGSVSFSGCPQLEFICIDQIYVQEAIDRKLQANHSDYTVSTDCNSAPPSCPIINFPDPNFKQALLNNSPVIDTDGDGEICIDEAEAAYLIIAPFKNISNTSGIEYFINVDGINLQANNIESIDLSRNTKLGNLQINGNRLTELNLDNNTRLNLLNFHHNNISEMVLGNHPQLRNVFGTNNKLTSFKVYNSPQLWNLQLDDNLLVNLDITGAPNLDNLTLTSNRLTEIDLSTNLELIGLQVDDNPLNKLDIKDNTKLNIIYARRTNIESINVTNCENVSKLFISDNPNLKEAYLSGEHDFYANLDAFTGTSRKIRLNGCPSLRFVCVNDVPFFNNIKVYINFTLGYLNANVTNSCLPTGPIIELPDLTNYFKLSPNPAVSYIKLTKKDSSVTATTATISTLTGVRVKTVNLQFTSDGGIGIIDFPPSIGNGNTLGAGIVSATINISDILPGTYVINVPSNKGILSGKFIKR
ncbi:hypothetical protein [uncultured Tenacibaculum sp.]|uniref:leucine-rich repeat domain-containing protein n=1 Tax=uncultured Tenacibaculum sp. TaxID=174713 RepID=UPI002611DE31|nr:hypothetical protein [uncultured Tenacibaculum sp.]